MNICTIRQICVNLYIERKKEKLYLMSHTNQLAEVLGSQESDFHSPESYTDAAEAAYEAERESKLSGLEMVRNANTLITSIQITTLEQVTCAREYDKFMANQLVINKCITELHDLLWAINARVFEDGFQSGLQQSKEDLAF